MNRVRNGIGWAALGAVWALTTGAPAVADDTEVFRFSPPPGTRANVLFVIDDSISMGTNLLTQPVYDPAVIYPSEGCDTTKVYWKSGGGDPPLCTTDQWFNLTALKCRKATQDFAASGQFIDDRMGQYDPSSGGRWRDVDATQKDRVVECQKDDGQHGDGGTPTHAWNGSSPAAWSTSSTNVSWSSRTKLTLYSGNYVNWWYGPGSLRTRLDVVQNVVDDLVDTLDGINVGLMDFNTYNFGDAEGSNGGNVSVAMGPIETNRAAMKTTIANLTANASTPLAETLFEARQYFAGKAVTYGTGSAPGSRTVGNPNVYDSPIDQACQNNFVVFLTDGEPTYDNQADAAIVAMTDSAGKTFTQLAGSGTCDVEAWAGIDFATPPGGQRSMCFDDVAQFLYQGDASSSLADTQRVRTITVGFTVDLPVLKEAAERGNGRAPGDSNGVYFIANNAAQLSSAFSDIIGGISTTTASFASPAVSVNAFNRTENLSDLFISVFKPSEGYHWPGNLKKYRLRDDGAIVDARNQRAVDPATGLFIDGTQSFWTAGGVFDGPDVEKGGAANIIPVSRLVYTNISGNDLNSTGNRVATGNPALTAAMLGTTATATAPLRRDDLIGFINGTNPISGQPRKQMGDPLHSQPVSFIYGPGLRDGLVFVATNDGYLHALHADTGVEQWAFMPREFLDDQIDLMENDDFPGKHYALDGPMRIQMIGDSDGVIETGEKVILYVGMRRGGSVYYALDITDPTDPQVLWRHDDTTLVGLGQSWSPPVPTQVKIGTITYPVVVIGGGYATNEDTDTWTVGGDAVGNSIYIIQANAGGTVLWRGTKNPGTGVTEAFNVSGRPQMDYSFPGEIRVLDMNGDKLMDRMYAGDMGGQVWRFDVTNGNAAVDLVVGGVIAQLGIAGDATPTLAENRRFYYAPDIAFVNTPTQNFVHIGIGSGHREHPLGTVNSDRFYAIRDVNVAPMDQPAFNALSIITEANLRAITSANTSILSTDKGWRINLQPGEKVLAEARTIANTVFFTTFRPGATPATCQPQPGFNRLYRVSVYNAAPVTNLDGGLATDPLSMSDMYVENTGNISSTSQVIFVSRDRDGDGIPDDQDPDDDNDGVPDTSDGDADNDGIPDVDDPDDDNDGILDVDEQAGDQGWACTDRICVPLGFTNAPVRTYWRQTSLD
jgi:type IV pilus assembly protein PilY1